MAVTRLSDAFVYDVYMSYQALENPETTAFWQSGIVASSSVLNQIARGTGKLAEVPFWNDLDPDIEPDYTNDDPEDYATPDKIDSGNMVARRSFLHKAWSTMDLVAELSGSSPMQHIRNRFGTYWTRQWQRRLIATVQGVIADNIANDDGDMGLDISGLAGDAAVFNSQAFIQANYTMGDRVGGLRAVAVHSAIAARMAENDEIVYVPDSQGSLTIPTYKGVRVIIDDSMPVDTSGDDPVYTSVLFGGGAFGFGGIEGGALGYGEGVPQVPAYVLREELSGNGGGQDIIGERKTWILHPFGFTWAANEQNLTEFSPTLADLRLATSWDRVVDRKQVPLAFIRSLAAPAA